MIKDKEQDFVKNIFKRFFIPSVLSSVGLAVGGLADCLFIGNQVGEKGLAVIGFASPLYMFFSLISIGISTGASIRYSSELSEGNSKKGNKIFTNILIFIFLFNVFCSIVGLILRPQIIMMLGISTDDAVYGLMYKYISFQLLLIPVIFLQAPFYYFVHCDNNPKLAASALISANVVDVLFNYIFLVVLKTGIMGSVISTALGALVTIIICLTHVVSKGKMLSFDFTKPDFSIIAKSMKTGFATASQYIYQFIAILVFNRILYGISQERGVAIFDVVYNISLLTTAVIEGIGLTMQPMLSTFLGERNEQNIKFTVKMSAIYGYITCLSMALLLAVSARYYLPVFGLADAAILSGSIWAIRLYMLSVIPSIINNLAIYYYQSVEKEKIAYILYALRAMIALIFFGVILSQMGFRRFWLCYTAAELSALLFIICYCIKKRSVFQLNFKENVFSAFLENGNAMNSQKIENLQEFCEENGLSFKQAYFVSLAVDEVCNTIFTDDEDDVYIQLTLVIGNGENVLYMRDNKKNSFNPFDTDTTKSDNMDNEKENIIGMKIVKSKAKEFFYRNYIGCNTLIVKF